MIRLARKEDLDAIMTIVAQTVEIMREEGNPQWGAYYPLLEDFADDIAREALYVYDGGGEAAGFVCLDDVEPEEYRGLPWRSEAEALFLHRFAVSPAMRRRGIGGSLLDFAENLARERGLGCIRTDTNSMNPKMQNLFAKHGFVPVGNIRLRFLPEDFVCFDKVL